MRIERCFISFLSLKFFHVFKEANSFLRFSANSKHRLLSSFGLKFLKGFDVSNQDIC